MDEIYNVPCVFFEKIIRKKGFPTTHCFFVYIHTSKNGYTYYANLSKKIPTIDIYDEIEGKTIKKTISGDVFTKWAKSIKYKDFKPDDGDRACTIGQMSQSYNLLDVEIGNMWKNAIILNNNFISSYWLIGFELTYTLWKSIILI